MEEKKGGLLGKVKGIAADQAHKREEQSAQRQEALAQQAEERAKWRQYLLEKGELYEYQVIQVRETLVGDKIKTDVLQNLLNEQASVGWRVKAITEASVSGRVGPGGVTGLIVTFERKVHS